MANLMSSYLYRAMALIDTARDPFLGLGSTAENLFLPHTYPSVSEMPPRTKKIKAGGLPQFPNPHFYGRPKATRERQRCGGGSVFCWLLFFQFSVCGFAPSVLQLQERSVCPNFI